MLVDPGERLLPEMTESMAEYAQSELEKRGVEVRLGRRISAAGPSWVEFDGGERIETHTLIWAGGVTANPIIKNLACEHGHHGTVTVNPFLAVPGRAGIWALGDCAEIPMPDRQGYYAPTAQNAFREGQVVARNIVAVLRAENPVRFEYRPAGELAVVGRHSAVARLFRFRFSGLPAWVMWRLIYLSKMPSLPQKVRILSDWVVDFVFGRNMALMRSVPGQQKEKSQSQPSSLPV